METSQVDISSKYFSCDSRMGLISGSKTIEEYATYIENLFRWRGEIPEDILNHFEIVKSLLVYSWYNYILIDEAVKKALFAYELAMKIRHKELTGVDWKGNWKSLIDKLYDMCLFDDNKISIQHDRKKRNYFAHPEGAGFGGVAFWKVLRRVVDNINGMYDNIKKRKERLQLKNDFDSFIKRELLKGFIVDFGDRRSLGHEIHCPWIDNRVDITRFCILVYYCTTDDFLKLNDAKDLPCDLLILENISFNEHGFDGLLVSDANSIKTIRICSLEIDTSINKFNEWKTKFESSEIYGDYNAYKYVYSEDVYQKCKIEYLYS